MQDLGYATGLLTKSVNNDGPEHFSSRAEANEARIAVRDYYRKKFNNSSLVSDTQQPNVYTAHTDVGNEPHRPHILDFPYSRNVLRGTA